MSELRRAVLSVDVIGSALRDIKDIRKEWEELKSRGAIPIDLKVNVSQTGQTLDVLARQVRDATAAYETLANTASSFHARSLQAIRPNVSPVIDVSAYKKVLSGAESLIGSTKLAIPGIISPPNVPKMGTSSLIESIKPALSGVLDSIEKEISTLSTGDVPKKIELPTPEIPEPFGKASLLFCQCLYQCLVVDSLERDPCTGDRHESQLLDVGAARSVDAKGGHDYKMNVFQVLVEHEFVSKALFHLLLQVCREEEADVRGMFDDYLVSVPGRCDLFHFANKDHELFRARGLW